MIRLVAQIRKLYHAPLENSLARITFIQPNAGEIRDVCPKTVPTPVLKGIRYGIKKQDGNGICFQDRDGTCGQDTQAEADVE